VRRFSPSKLLNGYFLSAVFHLLLFVLFAFYVIQPYLPEKWYSFEWEPLKESTVMEPANKEAITNGKNNNADAAKTISAGNPGNTELIISNETPSGIGDSEPAIAMPLSAFTEEDTKTALPNSYSRNRNANALNAIPGTSAEGNFAFSTTLEEGGGEAYFIHQAHPQISPTEEGEVYLEFKLTAKGLVNMSSVNVISYTNATYAEAVRKVMPLWKFGFKGSYNPRQLYRLRCRFVINE